MKIEKCDAKEFGFQRYAQKYSSIFLKIKEIKIGECIKVTLDEPNLNFYAILMQYFRKTRYPDYRCSIRRRDREGIKYLIMKIDRMVKSPNDD